MSTVKKTDTFLCEHQQNHSPDQWNHCVYNCRSVRAQTQNFHQVELTHPLQLTFHKCSNQITTLCGIQCVRGEINLVCI